MAPLFIDYIFQLSQPSIAAEAGVSLQCCGGLDGGAGFSYSSVFRTNYQQINLALSLSLNVAFSDFSRYSVAKPISNLKGPPPYNNEDHQEL